MHEHDLVHKEKVINILSKETETLQRDIADVKADYGMPLD
jgi:hypothetical protein